MKQSREKSSKKSEIKFFCQNCGYESLEWLGNCPGCRQWNTFVEELLSKKATILRPGKAHLGQVKAITEIQLSPNARLATGLKELDRVLGGGIVNGSAVLIGGEPGIGKSTLMLELAGKVAEQQGKVLYISAEESAQQIKLRAERLKVSAPLLLILSEVSLSLIEEKIEEIKPSLIIIDSIQTIYNDEIQALAGSVSQVKEVASFFVQLAKSSEIPLFLIGHVTKEGTLAGPRIVEHMVDTVLYFEGERHGQFRILRAVKNRFGSTNEIGVMEMTAAGLSDVANPSEIFLRERPLGEAGSVVMPAIEGTRPILVEIQALVSSSFLTIPRRTFSGVDYNRAAIVIAALEKKAGFKLNSHDIFINVAGGLQVDEPAADLGMALAIASAFKNQPVDNSLVVMGEVGLAGEIRAVSLIDKRIQEALKLGFKKCLIPAGNKVSGALEKNNLTFVKSLSEAIKASLE